MAKTDVVQIAQSRITGEYIANQYTGFVTSEMWQSHKSQISDNDKLYDGNLTSLFPDDDLPDTPLVENGYKNSLHDVTRLSSEAKAQVVFSPRGEDKNAIEQAHIREAVTDTFWTMSGARKLERKLYMDLLGTGIAALGIYFNDESEYPQVTRLDPRMQYPDIRNGKLISMLYAETLPLRQAEVEYPSIKFKQSDRDKNVLVLTYYDKTVVKTVVSQTTGGGKNVHEVWDVEEWDHGLDCVPVAFAQLDTFDSHFRGMFDQMSGPIMVRNKVISMLTDYLDDMVHAPYEAKNVMNAGDPQSPLRIYEHAPNADESFMRRVAPAAPAGSVWGLLQYLDAQESHEGLQPPARIGQLSQSIASGSFVASTQGGLSSAVKEVEDIMAGLRVAADYAAMKIDEKYLDFRKSLIRAVGKKTMYRPSTDIGGVYTHRVLYGATAGVGTQYADTRIQLHYGAGFISKDTARNQIDYLDDQSSEQLKIDREQMFEILKQRFSGDPNAPLSILTNAVKRMYEGDQLVDIMEEMTQALQKAEQVQTQGAPGQGPVSGEVGPNPEEAALAAEKGAVPTGATKFAPIEFAPTPLQQQIVRSG